MMGPIPGTVLARISGSRIMGNGSLFGGDLFLEDDIRHASFPRGYLIELKYLTLGRNAGALLSVTDILDDAFLRKCQK